MCISGKQPLVIHFLVWCCTQVTRTVGARRGGGVCTRLVAVREKGFNI
jgi:hypothetical protein